MRILYLCLYYDGNCGKACLLDFGEDPESGPLGNETAMRAAIDARYGCESSINGLVDFSDKADEDSSDLANLVVVDDQPLTSLDVVAVRV